MIKTSRLIAFIILLQIPLLAFCKNNKSNTCIDSTAATQIDEERFVNINGIEQWITIKGNKSKPVILFIHGGPGSVSSAYGDSFFGKWQADFTIVQWDQRGAGKTYGRTAPDELTPEYLQANPLSVAQLTADGIAIAEYISTYLGKQKLILFGTSWGSVLGVKIATARPDLFYAYVGHSQLVDPSVYFTQVYTRVYKMAKAASDTASLAVLDAIGAPMYNAARDMGKCMRVIKKYERQNSTPAPEAWNKVAPEYDNEKDAKNREDGDDYSFANFAGDKKLGIASIAETIHFITDDYVFKIPVYVVQGKEDILTPEYVTRQYFAKIKAPKKKMIVVPTAAHGFNEAVVNAQFIIMKRIAAGIK